MHRYMCTDARTQAEWNFVSEKIGFLVHPMTAKKKNGNK